MLTINFDKIPKEKIHQNVGNYIHFDLRGKSVADRVKLLILRDLRNVNWNVHLGDKKIIVSPPSDYDKNTIRSAMAMRRLEVLHKNKAWIRQHLKIARKNLASGEQMLNSAINPIVEICSTQQQMDLFRIFRYYWSSPYSEYVGRRIKLIIRDGGIPNNPVIGIAAIGSSIIHIPERDAWVGWDRPTRTNNLIYTMDAYVLGAMPPYNNILGGKLISYILASREIREIYQKKYKNKVTLINNRTSNTLVGIFTTSLYGKSSQYNRLKYNDDLLYIPIGKTKGFGSLHLSQQTIEAMVALLKEYGVELGNNFGNGPIWVMRVIRAAGDILGFDSDFLLKHSFQRHIYFTPHAFNYKEVLNGKNKRPRYTNLKMENLVEFWKERWFSKRKLNPEVLLKVLEFTPESFCIDF